MLKIYIKYANNVMKYNDEYFDNIFHTIKLNNNHAKIINLIDKSKLDIKNRVIIPKYNKNIPVDLTELSTGCKTALNVYSFPNIAFYANVCGKNALNVILKLKSGAIFIDDYIVFDSFSNEIEVYYLNKSKVIHNDSELTDILDKIFRV